jgi:putative ABC transport system permease protein
MRAMAGLPEVERAALVRTEPAATALPNQPAWPLQLVGTTDPAGAGTWTLVRGTTLNADAATASAPPPIIVAESLASRLGLTPGSSLRLRLRVGGAMSALPAADFRVTGIARFPFEPDGAYVVATTMAGLQRAAGGNERDEADMVLAASAPAVGPDAAAAAISRLRPDLTVFSNEQVITTFNRNGFSYFRQISIVLSTTTAAFTFLLVATLLTVSVNQRLGEVAALRALGIARRTVAATLLWEAVLLVGAGGLIALPSGALLAAVLDRILRRMPGLPDGLHFFVFEPRALALHGALMGLTALVAAAYPMWLAVHLPIALTLRREVVS